MLVLGLDFEASSLIINEAKIIEIGAILWCTETKTPKLIYSELLHWPGFSISDEITRITGITNNDLLYFGKSPNDCLLILIELIGKAEAIVAHNGQLYDKPLFIENLKKVGIDASIKTPWIDTTMDIEYPPEIKTRKLIHLAAEHGFINPFAHRAIFDVLTMLAVMARYDFHKILAFSQEPNIIIKAICQPPWEDNGVSTTEAKANGFYWDGSKKQWSKTCKQNQYQKEAEKAKTYKIAIVS